MDERQQQHLAQIVALELDLSFRAAESKRDQVFALHSSKGLLRSGATIKAVIVAIGETADGLLGTLVAKCGAISKDAAAFAIIERAVTQFYDGLGPTLSRLVDVAGGTGHPSITNAADKLLAQAKSDTFAKLEIERFAFDGQLAQGASDFQVSAPASRVSTNKGGKPLAAHWDEMWSSIAVLLYSGDLQPKTQADIERAMMGWFVDQEIEVGESTIRARARQLWQKIEAAT